MPSIQTPFNVTPNLGADFRDPETVYYWDQIGERVNAASAIGPSPQLGMRFTGNDGRDYLHVRSTPALAANARATVNETTWVATADDAGAWQAPVAVLAGELVWLRRFVL